MRGGLRGTQTLTRDGRKLDIFPMLFLTITIEILRYALDDGAPPSPVIQSEGCAWGLCGTQNLTRDSRDNLLSFDTLLTIMVEILRYALDDGPRQEGQGARCALLSVIQSELRRGLCGTKNLTREWQGTRHLFDAFSNDRDGDPSLRSG